MRVHPQAEDVERRDRAGEQQAQRYGGRYAPEELAGRRAAVPVEHVPCCLEGEQGRRSREGRGWLRRGEWTCSPAAVEEQCRREREEEPRYEQQKAEDVQRKRVRREGRDGEFGGCWGRATNAQAGCGCYHGGV